jgi:hypothetical protein
MKIGKHPVGTHPLGTHSLGSYTRVLVPGRIDSFTPEQWNEYQQLKARAANIPTVDLAKAQVATPPPTGDQKPPIKLDFGCGLFKKEGFLGVDKLPLKGVDVVLDVCEPCSDVNPFSRRPPPHLYTKWPWDDSSVDEVHASHFVEHLQFTPEKPERVHFVNEVWRVLKPGAKATIVVPNWASSRFHGDYTHRQPVSEFWPPYLSKAWRKDNAPHNDLYDCDFDCHQPAYSGLHPMLEHKNQMFKEFAITFGKEAAGDIMFVLVCKK